MVWKKRPVKQSHHKKEKLCPKCESQAKKEAKAPIFSCEICGQVFKYADDLNSHMWCHKDDEAYMCYICGKEFEKLRGLAKHMEGHPGTKCFWCGEVFSNQHCLQIHMRSHVSPTPKPKHIDKIIPEKKESPRKKSQSNERKDVDAGLCTMCYDHEGKTLKHTAKEKTVKEKVTSSHAAHIVMDAKRRERDYLQCFTPQKKLESRTRGKHRSQSPTGRKMFYTCSKCECGKYKADELLAHMMEHTKGIPITLYECSLCCNVFVKKRELKVTITKPTREAPYVCCECGRSFALKCAMTEHQKFHVIEKPDNCPECGELLNKIIPVVITTAGSNKIYQCEECTLAFHTLSSLNYHMGFHKGERPYLCPDCGRSFPTMGSLHTHRTLRNGLNCGHCSP